MKKFFFIMSLVLLFLTSCSLSAKNAKEDINQTNTEDDQYYFYKPTSTSLSMAESKNGYYFFGGPDNYFLYFMDKSSMKPIVLCNKPDCLHTEETDRLKVTNCNAFCNGINSSLICYQSNLYIFEAYPQMDSKGYGFYQVSQDGTQHKKIYTFKEMPTYLIIHRGFIYYTINDNGTITGKEAETVSKAGLFRISISDLSKEPELVYELDGIYAQIYQITGIGNRIFFLCGDYKDSLLQTYRGNLKSYDIENGIVSDVCSNIGHYYIYGDSIFYFWNGDNYTCKIDGTNANILPIQGDIIYCNDKCIITDTLYNKFIDKNTKRQLFVYNREGILIKAYNIDGLGLDLSYGGNGEYLFIPNNYEKTNGYGSIKSIWAAKINELIDGNASLKEIYEYIPQNIFPGFSKK